MTTRLFAFALAISALTGCAAADQMVRDAVATGTAVSTGAAGTIQTTAASWSTNAREFRDRAGTFAFDCPANPSQENTGSGVWGSGPYTDDSSVCKAGVQSGEISYERGGRVRIQPQPGQNRYVGQSRNGVSSNDYGAYAGSFSVVR